MGIGDEKAEKADHVVLVGFGAEADLEGGVDSDVGVSVINIQHTFFSPNICTDFPEQIKNHV